MQIGPLTIPPPPHTQQYYLASCLQRQTMTWPLWEVRSEEKTEMKDDAKPESPTERQSECWVIYSWTSFRHLCPKFPKQVAACELSSVQELIYSHLGQIILFLPRWDNNESEPMNSLTRLCNQRYSRDRDFLLYPLNKNLWQQALWPHLDITLDPFIKIKSVIPLWSGAEYKQKISSGSVRRKGNFSPR